MATITIAAMALKGTPTVSDLLEIADAAAVNGAKKVTAGSLPITTATQAALDGKAPSAHAHSGADITSGTVPVARLGVSGTRDTTTFLRGDNTFAVPPSGTGGVPANGSITVAQLAFDPATQAELDAVAAAKANATHAHGGADITSGTVPVARIGTGTKDTTTFYRGDGTFAVPSGTGGGGTGLAGVNTPQTVAYAATITPDLASGDIVKVGTLTGPLAVAAPSNYVAGRATLVLILTQDATGARAATFNAVYLGVPTLDTTASSSNVLTFRSDGTSWWLAALTHVGATSSAPAAGAATYGSTTYS